MFHLFPSATLCADSTASSLCSHGCHTMWTIVAFAITGISVTQPYVCGRNTQCIQGFSMQISESATGYVDDRWISTVTQSNTTWPWIIGDHIGPGPSTTGFLPFLPGAPELDSRRPRDIRYIPQVQYAPSVVAVQHVKHAHPSDPDAGRTASVL